MTLTAKLLGPDVLPRKGQTIEVHLYSYDSRCSCGGSASHLTRVADPEGYRRECVYQPNGDGVACGREVVGVTRRPDRVERGYVYKIGTSVLGTPLVYTATHKGARRVEDKRSTPWTVDGMVGWRLVEEA